MLWESLLRHITPEAIVAFLLGLLGIVVGSQAALRWGYTHAYDFGRWLARRLPGHAIEHFLAEQARGLHDGLEAEHGADAAVDASVTRDLLEVGEVTTLTVRVRPRAAALPRRQAAPTAAAQERSPSQEDPR